MLFRKFFRGRGVDEYQDESWDELPSGELPPPSPLTLLDYILAIGLGVVATFFISFVTSFDLHPNAWLEAAEAARLRTPTTILPGYWRLASVILFRIFGVGTGMALLTILGRIAFGCLCGLFYISFRCVLLLLIRKLNVLAIWTKLLARCVAATGALMLVCSDPIWMVCQSFTSRTLIVLLMAFAVFQSLKFYHSGRVLPAYTAMIVLGLLVAETPYGLVLTALLYLAYFLMRNSQLLKHMEILDVFVLESAKWHLLFSFVFGVLLGAALNIVSFIALDGPQAAGISSAILPVVYLKSYFLVVLRSASIGGWIIGVGFAAILLCVALKMFLRGVDNEYFLSFQSGLSYLMIGLFTYAQMSSLRPLWFWTWIKEPPMVSEPIFLIMLTSCFGLAFVLSAAVLSVNLFCRNKRAIANRMDSESSADEFNKIFVHPARLVLFYAVLTLLLVGLVPGRIQKRTLIMLNLFNDYVKEVVREKGDAQVLFTDGAFDTAIELEAERQKTPVACLSYILGPNSRHAYDVARFLRDEEDKLSGRVGVPNLLATWQRDKTDRLDYCAFQVGLDLWRRSGQAYPRTSGVLARTPQKMSLEESRAGVARAYGLIDRIMRLYTQEGGPSKLAGSMANELLRHMQWRLSRFARTRGIIDDLDGNVKRSLVERDLADSLDQYNASLNRIIQVMKRANELMMRQMTPREGLSYALVRADFRLAHQYAKAILKGDPDSENANFAMGMYYIEEEQYARAEEYLKHCLKTNPQEPAVWNNLAIVYMRMGKLESAKRHAIQALGLVPNSVEVRLTLSEINTKIEEKAKSDKLKEKEKAAEPQQTGAK